MHMHRPWRRGANLPQEGSDTQAFACSWRAAATRNSSVEIHQGSRSSLYHSLRYRSVQMTAYKKVSFRVGIVYSTP